MDETLIEVHEVYTGKASLIIRDQFDRFKRFRWVIGQDDEGYDVGYCVDRWEIFDWTDNPHRGGVSRRPHIEDWDEGQTLRAEHILRHMPEDYPSKVTVVLERK